MTAHQLGMVFETREGDSAIYVTRSSASIDEEVDLLAKIHLIFGNFMAVFSNKHCLSSVEIFTIAKFVEGLNKTVVTQTYKVCTAYEQGYGKGIDPFASDVNPYSTADLFGHEAWAIGFNEGRKLNIRKDNE
jgi:hypothetical protein